MSDKHIITPEALRPALSTLLSKAKHYGADQADAIGTHGQSLSLVARGGKFEDMDQSEGRDIGLRVMIGQRQACVSSSDLSESSLDKLAERAVAMAKLAPEDPYCGLADPTELAQDFKSLDLTDRTEISPNALLERAKQVEAAALSVSGVMQAEGSSASASRSSAYFMTSHGFEGGKSSSTHGLSGLALALQGQTMERDYDYESTRYFEDLPDPAKIGRTAGERATKKLGAKQLPSGSLPVIFDRRVSNALLSPFLGAINGRAITRGTSFLKDNLGEPIFGDNINIIDDPFILRGHGSRPWDGEGVNVQKTYLIENGVLKTWLLNTSAAKQLGLQTTGHAGRGISSPPGISTSNCYLAKGEKTPEALMQSIGEGLLIAEMFGPSLNANTGDYSVGVTGFKIENGQPAFPVNEITIAGNLKEMYKSLTPANDLVFNGPTVAPSLLVEGLTIAGT